MQPTNGIDNNIRILRSGYAELKGIKATKAGSLCFALQWVRQPYLPMPGVLWPPALKIACS
jgi:hypothetical protein